MGGAVVLVVDDHPIVRRGLVALLAAEPWVGQVVEATTVDEGLAAAVTARPDAAVVDLQLPDGTGLDLIPRLRRAVPGCRPLVLTMTQDPDTVRACMAAGAAGFLLKDTPSTTILAALRTVLDGGVVLGPDVSPTALGPRSTVLPPPFDRLSPTEIRLLGLVARGALNSEIAVRLGISTKTVRNRLTAILNTIGARDRVQAALMAREAGLHDENSS